MWHACKVQQKCEKKISTVVPLRPERVNKYVFITTRYVLLLVLYLYVSPECVSNLVDLQLWGGQDAVAHMDGTAAGGVKTHPPSDKKISIAQMTFLVFDVFFKYWSLIVLHISKLSSSVVEQVQFWPAPGLADGSGSSRKVWLRPAPAPQHCSLLTNLNNLEKL